MQADLWIGAYHLRLLASPLLSTTALLLLCLVDGDLIGLACCEQDTVVVVVVDLAARGAASEEVLVGETFSSPRATSQPMAASGSDRTGRSGIGDICFEFGVTSFQELVASIESSSLGLCGTGSRDTRAIACSTDSPVFAIGVILSDFFSSLRLACPVELSPLKA